MSDYHNSYAWRKAREIALKTLPHDCVVCGLQDLVGYNLTVDHRVPVIDGGTDDIDNLVIMCRSCNSKKGTRTYKRINYYNDRYIK